MAITRYDVVTAKDAASLAAAVSTGEYSPVGPIVAGDRYAMQAVGVGSVEVGSATDYEVVQAPTAAELVTLVNAKIGAGLQPVGGVTKWHNAFIQAVGTFEGGGAGASVAWDDVTAKPTTFAPVPATATVVGGLKTAAAPVIVINDPVDDENVQAAFDSLIAALKLSGVLT